jgi:hypothetical protein
LKEKPIGGHFDNNRVGCGKRIEKYSDEGISGEVRKVQDKAILNED